MRSLPLRREGAAAATLGKLPNLLPAPNERKYSLPSMACPPAKCQWQWLQITPSFSTAPDDALSGAWISLANEARRFFFIPKFPQSRLSSLTHLIMRALKDSPLSNKEKKRLLCLCFRRLSSFRRRHDRLNALLVPLRSQPATALGQVPLAIFFSRCSDSGVPCRHRRRLSLFFQGTHG